jgi:hypothetical protein
MARIESQAKAGFYPTPDSVCELLKTKITYEDGARLLDPCCGKGVTLSRLATASTTTCGIELSHERATEARTRLDKVLWADALQEVRFTYQAFGLLYLNPPYDQAMNPDGKSQRMETLFLRHYLNVLQLSGFLIFVIPYYVLANEGCAKAIARNFKIQVLGFPEDEFQAFKQCIVFGKRQRIAAEQAESTELRLNKLGRMDPEDFNAEVAALESVAPVSIHVPAAKKPLAAFSTSRFDPAMGIPVIRKAGILQGVLEELAPRKKNFIRPLSMLENGHLALVLAGGFMNGEIEKDGKRLVVKGIVKKESPVVNSSCAPDGDGGTITIRDKYIPTVKVIDMEKATLLTVQ